MRQPAGEPVSSSACSSPQDDAGTLTVTGRAEDGLPEAVEDPARRFVVGVQWHPEAFATRDNPGNRLFSAFVQAAQQRP